MLYYECHEEDRKISSRGGRDRDLKPIRAVVTHLKTFFSLCMTFKEVVKEKLIIASKEYKKLMQYDYHIQSNSFLYQSEYILRFYEDNFLHLTGIKTNLKAKVFYKKCLNKYLSDEDFDCDSNKDLKNKVKEKLKNLSRIGDFFCRKLVVQENFAKNRIQCKIASSDGLCTLGFVCIKDSICVPKTLLNRKQTNPEFEISNFVLSKKRKG